MDDAVKMRLQLSYSFFPIAENKNEWNQLALGTVLYSIADSTSVKRDRIGYDRIGYDSIVCVYPLRRDEMRMR
jgi:hypothetical protein